MKGFLLDTNIPSEMTRPSPQSSVSSWLDQADDDRLYFSVVSLGEVLKGVTLLAESKRRTQLQQLDGTLRPWF
jgi:predicted nucleic acid-binding protein